MWILRCRSTTDDNDDDDTIADDADDADDVITITDGYLYSSFFFQGFHCHVFGV